MDSPGPSQQEQSISFDRVEEAFGATLDIGLNPRRPDSLYDLVARLDLPPGATAVDIGCGRGTHSVQLAARFAFNVLGIDPVLRTVALGAPPIDVAAGTVQFTHGTAEALPVDASSVDLVWCREVIAATDLELAAAEFVRVLRPGGHGLIYQALRGPRMTDAEADELARLLRGDRVWRPSDIDDALIGAGLDVTQRVDFSGEWGEAAQEQAGVGGRRLLHAARLLRAPDRYIDQFGESAYEIMLGDCLWHVYRMIGKLAGYACNFTKPA